jgi:hypothetical protein
VNIGAANLGQRLLADTAELIPLASGDFSGNGLIARCTKLVDFSLKARSFLVKCGDLVGDSLPLARGNFLNKRGLFLAKR